MAVLLDSIGFACLAGFLAGCLMMMWHSLQILVVGGFARWFTLGWHFWTILGSEDPKYAAVRPHVRAMGRWAAISAAWFVAFGAALGLKSLVGA